VPSALIKEVRFAGDSPPVGGVTSEPVSETHVPVWHRDAEVDAISHRRGLDCLDGTPLIDLKPEHVAASYDRT
jgi:tRNA (Thr-GGU) A37 N-methylase